MSKTVNKVQSDMLLTLMQGNPGIARNFVKENKEKVVDFWKQVEKKLNSAGPPLKSIPEWKKVWMDQKRYVRKKAANNLQHQRGPNREVKLSPMEENIFQLIGGKESIEGIESARYFGIAQSAVEKENEVQSCDDAIDDIQYDDNLPTTSSSTVNNKNSDEHSHTVERTFAGSNKKSAQKRTTSELVEKELETQKKLCEKMCEVVDMMKENYTESQSSTKKIYRSLDRLSYKQTLLLEETKRHNLEIEKLKKAEHESKIKRNRLMIELHKIQLQKERNKTGK